MTITHENGRSHEENQAFSFGQQQIDQLTQGFSAPIIKAIEAAVHERIEEAFREGNVEHGHIRSIVQTEVGKRISAA